MSMPPQRQWAEEIEANREKYERRLRGAVEAAGMRCVLAELEVLPLHWPDMLEVRTRIGFICPCRQEPLSHFEQWTFHTDGPPLGFQFTHRLVSTVLGLAKHIDDDIKKGLV